MKTRVLLIVPAKSRFILADFRHLRQVFDVEFYQPRLFLRLKKGASPLRFLNLFSKVVRSSAVVCWFANVDSLFACLFARVALKRSIIIVGGVDAAYEPTINYGHFVKWTSRLIDTLAYKLANVIAPVDASLAIKLIAYLPFCIEKKLVVFPTGYDPKEWYPSGEKENLVLTVASVDWETFYLKGLQTFIRSSEVSWFMLIEVVKPSAPARSESCTWPTIIARSSASASSVKARSPIAQVRRAEWPT